MFGHEVCAKTCVCAEAEPADKPLAAAILRYA